MSRSHGIIVNGFVVMGTLSAALPWCALTLSSAAPTAWADEAQAHWGSDVGTTAMGDGAGSAAPLVAQHKTGRGKRAAGLRVRTLALGPLAPQQIEEAPHPGQSSFPHPLKCRKTGVLRDERMLASPGRMDRSRESVLLPDGRVVWTCEVSAEGAEALRMEIRAEGFDPSAAVVAYDADEPGESYSVRLLQDPATGTWGALTPSVFGSRARIEFAFPDAAAARAARVRIERVVHAFDAAGDGQEDSFRAGSCHNKVACSTYAGSVAYAVARLSFLSGGTQYMCSGSLIADLDSAGDKPYMLTAYHCISTPSEAATLECYWDYKEPCSGGSAPSLSSVPRTSQAVILATAPATDATLLQLVGTMPSSRYYLGWTNSTPSVNASIGCAHHPTGVHMKASYGKITSIGPTEHFVQWTSGVTEGGSSGSPLLNASEQILGQLWAGYSSCSTPAGLDCYGRFDYSYSSFSDWLARGDGQPGPPDPDPPPYVPPVPAPVAPPPFDLFATAEDGGIRLRWRESSADFFSVEIRRRDGGAGFVPAASVAPGVFEHLDAGALGGWPHTYVLRALNQWGPSRESEYVTAEMETTGALDVVAASLKDASAPRKDAASARFTLVPLDGAQTFDPALHALRVQMGQAGAPVDISVPAGSAGWKVSKKKAVWKSAKGALPKTTVTVARASGEFSVSVKSFDFAATPGLASRILAAVGAAAASHAGGWTVRAPGWVEIR